jgi:hypothetical protein
VNHGYQLNKNSPKNGMIFALFITMCLYHDGFNNPKPYSIFSKSSQPDSTSNPIKKLDDNSGHQNRSKYYFDEITQKYKMKESLIYPNYRNKKRKVRRSEESRRYVKDKGYGLSPIKEYFESPMNDSFEFNGPRSELIEYNQPFGDQEMMKSLNDQVSEDEGIEEEMELHESLPTTSALSKSPNYADIGSFENIFEISKSKFSIQKCLDYAYKGIKLFFSKIKHLIKNLIKKII